MFVQAIDKKFYLKPKFHGDNFNIRFDEVAELSYKTKNAKSGKMPDLVSWKTARQVLRPAGISASEKNGPYQAQDVFKGKMQQATVYTITLIRPIPIPTDFDLCVTEKPWQNDFEIIDFDEKVWRRIGDETRDLELEFDESIHES